MLERQVGEGRIQGAENRPCAASARVRRRDGGRQMDIPAARYGAEDRLEIARQLNRGNIANHHGRPWTYIMVHSILRNENYIGNLVYNRTSRRLGQTQVNNPDQLWIRSLGVVPPVIDQDLFARAQKIMAERYISIPEDQMLRRLRLTLARKGKLTTRIIKNAPGLPSVACYIKRFGSLRQAYALIGYQGSRDCEWFDVRDHWSEVLSKLA